MRNRLCALAMVVMMLIVPVGGLSAGAAAFGALATSALPRDTVIRFPDPNFEAAVREIIGKAEGELTASEVARITGLDVPGRGIADLTGIEYFAALKVLDCGDNQLTTLDVSRNFALKKLYCQGDLIPYPSDIKGLNLKRISYFVFHP